MTLCFDLLNFITFLLPQPSSCMIHQSSSAFWMLPDFVSSANCIILNLCARVNDENINKSKPYPYQASLETSLEPDTFSFDMTYRYVPFIQFLIHFPNFVFQQYPSLQV